MDLIDQFRMLARYNRVANERLFACCAQLEDGEYRKERQGSFGSIRGLLNHLLLGDQIWMARFEEGGSTTPPLHSILFDDFAELRSARAKQDMAIEMFFDRLPQDFVGRSFRYINHQGIECVEEACVAIAHFFNHHTHHRAQVHVMLSQTSVKPPSLDLHRIINP